MQSSDWGNRDADCRPPAVGLEVPFLIDFFDGMVMEVYCILHDILRRLEGTGMKSAIATRT